MNAIYHYCNAGSLPWYAFAKADFQQPAVLKRIIPISNFPIAAAIPTHSAKDRKAIERYFEYRSVFQHMALDKVIAAYQKSR